jgi:hypothetical protein
MSVGNDAAERETRTGGGNDGRERAGYVARTGNAGRAGHAAGRAREAERWLALLTPEALPPGVERTVNDAHSRWYRVRLGASTITVVVEIEVWQGEFWAHLAATGRSMTPTLAEIGWCREAFLGDRKAIQVLPRKAEAFDAGLRSVHLYAPLESDALPSFSRAYHAAGV